MNKIALESLHAPGPPGLAQALPVGRLAHDQMPPAAMLMPGRMHEATGPGRRAFAAAIAGGLAGPVLWLIEARLREMLCPQGLAAHFDPARLILVRPMGHLTLLQVMEEALRSGAAPLVVAELGQAADLTQSRRLQLAAGAGGGIGLCLVPESGLGTNAAESRWHAAPLPAPTPGTAPGQRWTLLKSKRGRPGAWEVTLGSTAGQPFDGRTERATPATARRRTSPEHVCPGHETPGHVAPGQAGRA